MSGAGAKGNSIVDGGASVVAAIAGTRMVQLPSVTLINSASPNISFEIRVGKSHSRGEAEVRRSAEVDLAAQLAA